MYKETVEAFCVNFCRKENEKKSNETMKIT